MPEKILRLPNVLDRTGLSRSTVYLRVTEGRFPRPVSLGARAVGWIETEVEEWIARQIEVSREIRGQRHWRESVVVKMRPGVGFRLGIRLGLDCRAWPDSLPAELTEWLCRCSSEGQHFASALGALQKIGPVLHHLGAWLQVESVVVRRAHRVPGA